MQQKAAQWTQCRADCCTMLHNSNANGKFNAFSKAAHNCSELVKAMHGQSTGRGATLRAVKLWFIDHLSPKKQSH